MKLERIMHMGMSTSVCGVRDLDGKFADMMALKLACEKTSVSYPKEVADYFDDEDEDYDITYSEDELREYMESVDITDAVREYTRDATDIIEVDLSKLPDGVKAVRFQNSY